MNDPDSDGPDQKVGYASQTRRKTLGAPPLCAPHSEVNPMKKSVIVVATAAALAGLSVGSASAADWLYYSVLDAGTGKVGRVQLDGTTGRDDGFVSFGSDTIRNIAATNSALYVSTGASQTTATLTRVDASGTKTTFFSGAAMCSTAPGGATGAYGLATDGQYLYYICESGTTNSSARSLARVSLDGTTRDEGFSGSLSGVYASSSVFAVSGGYAYFKGGTSMSTDTLYRVALTSGATATPASTADAPVGAAGSPAGLFAIGPSGGGGGGGPTRPIQVFQPSAFPGWTATTRFSGLSIPPQALAGTPLAANTESLFWSVSGSPFSQALAKGAIQGSASPNMSFLTMSGSKSFVGDVAVDPTGPGGGSTPTPAPAPVPAPAPAQAATVLKAPTQSTTADSNGNVAVTLSLQLDEVGKYTFIFEKVTSNEMSREQATGSNRISMQKGTKIGKRKLTKVVTAANLTTTSTGAKLVMKALLKKAQAKKWNLRVIHTATDGSQTQSVISK